MKWVKAIFTSISVALMGMYGGQKEKGVRRYGIPGLSILTGGLKGWPFLLLIPVLILGYGHNSWLMDKIGIEWVVRLAYAFLLSIPFYFFGIKRGAVALASLLVAFQIHAGSAGYVSWFGDILIEDLIRYGTLGILISFNLFF